MWEVQVDEGVELRKTNPIGRRADDAVLRVRGLRTPLEILVSSCVTRLLLRRGGGGVRQFLGTRGSHPDEDGGVEGEAAFRRRARFVRL